MPKHVFEKFSNILRHSGNPSADGASRIPNGSERFWTSQNDGINRKKRRKSAKKITPKTRHIRILLGIIFILIGFAWFAFLYRPPTLQTLTDNLAKEPIMADRAFKKEAKESDIKSVVIPRLNIDLSVAPSEIKNGYWEVSEISASHGQGSANPGENGNVVVFAHAREGLFLGLRDIKKDDAVYILTNDRWYRYRVSEIISVYPNDITTVAPTDSEILTLFTCSGFFDDKRLIVKAIPEE